jgi:hypothetical protein
MPLHPIGNRLSFLNFNHVHFEGCRDCICFLPKAVNIVRPRDNVREGASSTKGFAI